MTTEAPPEQTDVLVERLFAATIGALGIASVHVGASSASTAHSPTVGQATPGELAARTGTAERYVREWPEQQAVAGFLSVDDPDAGAGERRCGLPADHRPVLVDEEDLNYLTPLATLAMAVCRPMGALLEAYRTGGGVPYEAYDLHEAVGAINRPQFVNELAGWLASIPEVDARLRAQPSARVADLACGTAWSSIAIARAYPGVTVDAVDVDAASIKTAHANVAAARGWPTGCGRPCRTRAPQSWADPTTWSRSSRPCMT